MYVYYLRRLKINLKVEIKKLEMQQKLIIDEFKLINLI